MCCTPPQPVLSPPALHVHHVRPVGGALWAWWAPVYFKGALSGPTGSTAVFFYTVDNIDNNNGKASDRGQEAPPVRDFRGSAVECPLSKGKKLDRCSKVINGFPVSIPSALVRR